MLSLRQILFLVVVVGLALVPSTQTLCGENGSLATAQVGLHVNPDSHLLEIGYASKSVKVHSADAIKAVSYNIRWRGGEDLRKLAKLLKDDPEIGGAAILALQEVDRNKKRTGNQNTIQALAEELGMHYAWAAPPAPKAEKEEETGVAIMSPYPLSEVQRIVLPHEGPGKRRRVALGASAAIGTAKVRVYSVHSETRMPFEKKLDQMKAVLADLAHHPRDIPAIVLGDLNTWEPGAGDKTAKLFTTAGFHTPFDGQSTFCREVLFVSLKFKLDWIWLRNVEASKHGVDRQIRLSDHWPLWVNLSLKRVAQDNSKATS